MNCFILIWAREKESTNAINLGLQTHRNRTPLGHFFVKLVPTKSHTSYQGGKVEAQWEVIFWKKSVPFLKHMFQWKRVLE